MVLCSQFPVPFMLVKRGGGGGWLFPLIPVSTPLLLAPASLLFFDCKYYPVFCNLFPFPDFPYSLVIPLPKPSFPATHMLSSPPPPTSLSPSFPWWLPLCCTFTFAQYYQTLLSLTYCLLQKSFYHGFHPRFSQFTPTLLTDTHFPSLAPSSTERERYMYHHEQDYLYLSS